MDSISGICDTPSQNSGVTVEEAVVGMDRWSREKKDTLVDLILSCLDAHTHKVREVRWQNIQFLEFFCQSFRRRPTEDFMWYVVDAHNSEP